MAELSKVIIAGAGIGGLTTAVALRRAGVETVVLERRTEPGRLLTGGGFMLWHNAVLALRELKLDEEVAAAGQPIDVHEFRDDRGRRLAAWPVGQAAARIGAPALAMRRAHLNTVLMSHVEDSVRLGVAVTGFDQDGDSVTAHLSTGQSVTGDLLVGADGLRSAVRSALRRGHDLPPRYAGYTAWQAITELPADDAGEGGVRTGTFYNLWGRGGLRFLYCRLNEREVYWDAITCDHVSGAFDTVRHGKRDLLAHAYRHWPDPVPRIVASTPEEAVLPIDIVDRPPGRAGAWSSGRAVLVGDAAHPMTLNLSQGAGQSIEDAVALGRLLQTEPTVPAALARYEHVRRDRAMAMVRTSYNIGRMGRWRDTPRSAMRGVFMRAFFGSVGLKGSYDLMMGVNLRPEED
jgi:2-polyprenyl-6-methoxyphenol hydroxylase-like FAD-dependent oxidoreductase